MDPSEPVVPRGKALKGSGANWKRICLDLAFEVVMVVGGDAVLVADDVSAPVGPSSGSGSRGGGRLGGAPFGITWSSIFSTSLSVGGGALAPSAG